VPDRPEGSFKVRRKSGSFFLCQDGAPDRHNRARQAVCAALNPFVSGHRGAECRAGDIAQVGLEEPSDPMLCGSVDGVA
jgi:hypothetical protein